MKFHALTASKDKSFIEFDNLYHETLNEDAWKDILTNHVIKFFDEH